MAETAITETGLIHIVDDDVGVRESLGFLLETAGFSVRSHASAAAVLAAVAPQDTGCLITDVRMPGMDGLALQKHLAERSSHLSVIVMTAHGDIPMAVRALKGGAVDFLEKPFNDKALLDAVQRALVASRKAAADAATARAAAVRLDRLTAREKEVLHGLIAGQANKEIAIGLGVSPRTVEVHRARVMEKMEAESLPDLIHQAMSAGVAPPDRAGGPAERAPRSIVGN